MRPDLNCRGCAWLELITDPLPHDKTGFLCREPNWGGYVTPDMPLCEGMQDGKYTLIRFAPAQGLAKRNAEGGQ